MTTYDKIETIIEEWFSEYAINGQVEVAKLYAHIRLCADKQLEEILSPSINSEPKNLTTKK